MSQQSCTYLSYLLSCTKVPYQWGDQLLTIKHLEAFEPLETFEHLLDLLVITD